MAALDLRSTQTFPHTATTTVTNTALREIQLPVQAGKVTVSSKVGEVYLFAVDGLSDGDSVPSSGYFPIPSSNALSLNIGRGSTRRSSIFVAFATHSSGLVHVVVEEI